MPFFLFLPGRSSLSCKEGMQIHTCLRRTGSYVSPVSLLGSLWRSPHFFHLDLRPGMDGLWQPQG